MNKSFLFFLLICFVPFIVTGQNMLANAGFEDGDADANGIPDGWIGYAQTGASMQLFNEAATAHSGQYWAKCTSTNGGYYLLYQNTFPTVEGDVWDFSAFIKDISPAYPGAVFAALKISAKNAAGGTFKAWEVYQNDVSYEWARFSNIQTMPAGTAFIQAVIVVHGADGAPEASYGFDDVSLERVYQRPPASRELNILANPGFEAGDADANGIPDGWIGYAQTGASMQLMNDAATAFSGSYWAKCTSTLGGYYLLYQQTYPATKGEVWKFSSFIKDLSPAYPGADFVALKISAKNASGGTFQAWEVFQTGLTTYWKDYSNTQTMPEGTKYIQAVIVVHGADGAPEATYGFDDVRLELVHEMTNNPGFEDGDSNGDQIPDGWLGGGTAGKTHMETIKDSTAHSGQYWTKVNVDSGDGYYVLYQAGFPANPGEIWSLRSYIKNVSPDSAGDFAFLKISAKNPNGSNVMVWEVRQTGVSRQWKDYHNTQTMPLGTTLLQPVLVVKKSAIDSADFSLKASYGFDDVRVVKLGVADIMAPSAPGGVTVENGTKPNTNSVAWLDVAGEKGETYALYASQNPITKVTDPGVEVLATGVAKGTQKYVHSLRNPYTDSLVTYYYAVTATDTAGNVSALGLSPAHTNTAVGTATISRTVPANFAADGDITEWDGTGVMPFTMSASKSHVGTGTFTGDHDLSMLGYMGVDDENLYLSYWIKDDKYSYNPTATYYKNDVVFLYIGLYDLLNKHTANQRGTEPDYRFNFLSTYLRNANAGAGTDTLFVNGSANYCFVATDSHYVIEAKIPFKDILVGAQKSDALFHPQVGMTIPMDIEICDSDADGVRDGLLTFSSDNNDQSWKGPQYWTYSWIDDRTNVTAVDESPAGVVYEYALQQNHPNPFNPVTRITYSLAKSSYVSITVYDILGKEVARLVQEKQDAGHHAINFSGQNLATGLYFYRIQADQFSQTRKMMLIK
jgi:hypothetical protein